VLALHPRTATRKAVPNDSWREGDDLTAQTRAAVWLDHREARIFHVDLDGFDEETVRAPLHRFHRHPKGPAAPHAHPDDVTRFFEEIVQALASADEILVLGPSTAKNQLLNYVRDHAHALAGKVTGIETSDYLNDAQLVAHVRHHYRIATPRMR